MMKFRFLYRLTSHHIVKTNGFRSKFTAKHLHDLGANSSGKEAFPMEGGNLASPDPLISASWPSGTEGVKLFTEDMSKRMFRVEGLLTSMKKGIGILRWQMSVLLGLVGAGGPLLLYAFRGRIVTGGGSGGSQPIFITLLTPPVAADSAGQNL